MDNYIKCFNCQKKIKLIPFKCKCEHDFCLKCKDSLDHNCQFDYKKEFKEKLTKLNPVIAPDKLEIIT